MKRIFSILTISVLLFNLVPINSVFGTEGLDAYETDKLDDSSKEFDNFIDSQDSYKEVSELDSYIEYDEQNITASISLMSASTIEDRTTSRLGHIRRENTRIYEDLNDLSTYETAGTTFTHAVYYIKREAEFNDDLYYLISRQPNDTHGVVGWVKESDLSTHQHLTVDANSKNLYVRGNGSAFSKPWGGRQDLVFEDMSQYQNQVFRVNLTERVGNNIWYRGTLGGETVWLHSSYVMDQPITITESTTSRLGHIRHENVRIYEDINNLSNFTTAGTTYTHAVYYIKRQADLNGETYFLISHQPSATNGVVGWVKGSDMSSHAHVGVDREAKILRIKGTGSAYSKAWGGRQDIIFEDMESYAGQEFRVHLTERVGNNIWYRGTLDGETVWLHSSFVDIPSRPIREKSTSKLGHIRNTNVRIYNSLVDLQNYEVAGSTYTNAVYYIKREATLGNKTYYLISHQPSATNGVVGWIDSADLSTHSHVGIDRQPKTFYVKGIGRSFSKAWGGSKDLVFEDMTKYTGQQFMVNLTERVGNNVWYRGTLDGETIWLHSSYVSETNPIEETQVSRLGHIRNGNVKIYEDLTNLSSYQKAGNTYTNAVYYIKLQAQLANETYYLISQNPSSTSGVVGWIKASDLSTHTHVSVDRNEKIFYVRGIGSAYSKAWGGRQDLVYEDLSNYKDQEFRVNLTERVGNNTWYRGSLDGKTVWLHSSYVSDSITTYTNYNLTLNQMIDIQLGVTPQTDRYRNEPAYIHSSLVSTTSGTATIDGTGVALRTEPTTSGGNSTVHSRVNTGTTIEIVKGVSGSSVSGSTLWYEIRYNGSTLYVHSSLVNNNSQTARLTSNGNVRAQPNTNSHVYAKFNSGRNVNILNEVSGSSVSGSTKWYQISLGAWRLPTRSDLTEFVDPDLQDPFQFLVLSQVAGATAAELNQELSGRGVLHGKGQQFIDGAKRHGVNEAYLVSHALLESGNGTSRLATGVEVGLNSNGTPVVVTSSNRGSLTQIKTVYNMYGINARDSDPLNLGATYAYRQGWTSPDIAIVEGAAFVSQSYFNRNQDTLYKMRWNPANPGTYQYATDIGWAAKQVSRMKSIYSRIDNPRIVLDIPVYK